MSRAIEMKYRDAKEAFGKFGIDTDNVLGRLKSTPVSINCWQGDDVAGFEDPGAALAGGGILATGNHPGKPRNIDEFRMDTEKAFSMIPGNKKLALHAIYGDFPDGLEDRRKVDFKHFKSWSDWAKENECGLDFNPTMFSHKMAESGYTLSDDDKGVRDFWIEHVQNCRKICDFLGDDIGITCYNNLWLPDGSKDETVSRLRHRENLISSLDEIFKLRFEDKNMQDSLESKLFGIGVERSSFKSEDKNTLCRATVVPLKSSMIKIIINDRESTLSKREGFVSESAASTRKKLSIDWKIK